MLMHILRNNDIKIFIYMLFMLSDSSKNALKSILNILFRLLLPRPLLPYSGIWPFQQFCSISLPAPSSMTAVSVQSPSSRFPHYLIALSVVYPNIRLLQVFEEYSFSFPTFLKFFILNTLSINLIFDIS